MRTKENRAKEKAVEFVEKSLYLAKDAFQKEMQLILKQVDKTTNERDEMIRSQKFLESAAIEQEKIIT